MYQGPNETIVQAAQHLLRAISSAVRGFLPNEELSIVVREDGSGHIFSTAILEPVLGGQCHCAWSAEEDPAIVIISWIGGLVQHAEHSRTHKRHEEDGT